MFSTAVHNWPNYIWHSPKPERRARTDGGQTSRVPKQTPSRATLCLVCFTTRSPSTKHVFFSRLGVTLRRRVPYGPLLLDFLPVNHITSLSRAPRLRAHRHRAPCAFMFWHSLPLKHDLCSVQARGAWCSNTNTPGAPLPGTMQFPV